MKKLLFIGLDGTRIDCLLSSRTYLQKLFQHDNAKYSTQCKTNSRTISGPSWSTILSGKNESYHNIHDNETVESLCFIRKYDTFLSLLENQYNIHTYTGSWIGIHNIVKSEKTTNKFINITNDPFENDTIACDEAIDALSTNKELDILFLYFMNIDASGHEYGFGLHCKEYNSSIKKTDLLIQKIMETLETRKNKYKEEDWLIVFTTDHGGTDWNCMSKKEQNDYTNKYNYYKKGVHGLNIPSHTNTWLLCINEAFANEEILPSPISSNIYSIVMNHFDT